MLTTLHLRRAATAVREPVAWFLPGDDPAEWLDEIARWPVPLHEVAFHLVRRADSPAAQSIAGALVVPPPGARVPVGGRGQPFGRATGGVYLPVDACIHPPVTAEELRALSVYPVLIFHPALGLTGCEEREVLRAWDLLAAVEVRNENWSLAHGGASPAPVLRGVRLQIELALEEIFGPESDDIGSEAPELLPPAPDEPSNNIAARFTQGAAEAVAKALLGLAALVPHRPGIAPTWVNRLENWASQKLAGLTRDLDRSRHRELHRLLDLLKRQPHEGLRHAIPLAGLAHRGRGAPSGLLGRRSSLDFNLSRLGGGRAADFWDIPADLQSSLATSYRELALREAKLGQHRRAAFIYAELLGDLAAAAGVLKEGRHFREAALLYRERLKNPLAAAQCLAEGGLLAEAVALYEEQQHWLEAADLHARLGDVARERAAIRKAVDARRGAGDVVGAARLIDTRLADPDEALQLLASEWPAGRQALVSLEERFALLVRRQRPDAACALAAELARESLPLSILPPVIDILAKLNDTATDARVRHAAAEAARAKAARGLTGRALPPKEEWQVLQALTRLAPGDRLMQRDAQRFRDARVKPPPRAPASASSAAVLRITPEKSQEFQLWRPVSWCRVAVDAEGIYAVGRIKTNEIYALRRGWSGSVQPVEWRDPAPQMGSRFVLLSLPHDDAVLVNRPLADRLEGHLLAASADFSGKETMIGAPAWFPADAVEAASSGPVVWAVRVVSDRVILDAFQDGRCVTTRDVTDALKQAGATGHGTSLSLAVHNGLGRVALGYGSHVLLESADAGLKVCAMGERVTGLLPVRGPAEGWVVLLERGAAWLALDGSTQYTIDHQLDHPRGAVLADHRLVLLGCAGGEGSVIRLEPSRAIRQACFFVSGDAELGLFATPEPNEFAVFSANGLVRRWRLPG